MRAKLISCATTIMNVDKRRACARELALAVYERPLELKRLVPLPGAHFVPYVSALDTASLAVDWFQTHIGTVAED